MPAPVKKITYLGQNQHSEMAQEGQVQGPPRNASVGQGLCKENSIPQKSLLSAFPHREQPGLSTKQSHVTGQECGGTAKEQYLPIHLPAGAYRRGICGGATKTQTVTSKGRKEGRKAP